MRKFLPYYILLLFTQFVFSQTSKTLQGKVFFKENPVRDVEVINWNKKTITKSDANGIFYIETAENDTLYFLSKNHLDKKVNVRKVDIRSNDFKVYLVEKTIDLEELTIIQSKSAGLKVTQGDIDQTLLQKEASRPVNKSVNMGTIENGMDFVKIFKGLAKLFKNKDEPNKLEIIPVDFKKFIRSKFDTTFFVKNLNLKPDEIAKFIAYCNADDQAANIVEHSNILTVMDFLSKKSDAFKKL